MVRAKPHKWTNEQIEYVTKVSAGRYNDEIAALVNERYEVNLCAEQIRTFKSRRGIKSNAPKSRLNPNPGLFTKEQKVFIEQNVKGLPNKDLAELVNEKFGLSITTKQITSYKNNNKLTSGLNGRFTKGQGAWNKGLLGLDFGGETRFSEGHVPHNYQPVGTVRINGKGYVDVKTADPNVWKKMHRLVWENEHGPIPKNHVVIFLDGDKQNITLDNLNLVKRGELARLNQAGMFSENPELTKVGISITRVQQKVIDHELRGGINSEEFAKYVLQAKKNGISRGALGARLRRGWTLNDALNKPLGSKVKK